MYSNGGMLPMVEIKEVFEPIVKTKICGETLRALPDWFGVEASIADYEQKSGDMPFFAAFDGEKAVGFVAIKVHNAYTSEVCVMGILKDYHRQGIGQRLIGLCEVYCARCGMEFLTVKTLDSSRESRSYAKTRLFYEAMGFKPLEVFPLLWDEDNPCLFLAKHIAKT